MAWAEKLPSGKYRGLYRDAFDKRRSAGTFTHKAAAVRRAGALEDKARLRRWSDPDAAKMPWGKWCEEWWQTRTVEAATLATDRGRRDTHLMPKWETVPLGAINRLAVEGWRAEMRTAGVSHSTINRAVALLSVSLSAAVNGNVLEVNPLLRLEKLKEPPAKHQVLTKDSYKTLLKNLPSKRDQLIVTTLASTGLRWGELAGLHRARVDFDACTFRVVDVWVERVGVMKPYPKGGRERIVPVPDWLMSVLADLPHEGQTCGVTHSSGKCPGPLLLTTDGGSVLRNTNWSPVFRKAVEAGKIGPLRIHDLRGTAASWWLDGEVTLAEVRVMLGHQDPRTTDRYAGLSGVNGARATGAIPRPT